MAVTYKKTSPYAGTSIYGSFLDVLTYRKISKKADDVTYTINSVYKYRPDTLAFDLYGDPNLWWVFAVRNPNVIRDPIFDFKPGVTIYIPKKDTLIAELGI